MTYQTEFPDFDPATMPAIPAEWVDTSWHNDACPSFKAAGTPDDKAPGWWSLRVFIDYAKPEDRQFSGGPRFTVHHDSEAGTDFPYEGDDWEVVVAFVPMYAAIKAPAKPKPVYTIVQGVLCRDGKPILTMGLYSAYAGLRCVGYTLTSVEAEGLRQRIAELLNQHGEG